MEGEVEEEVEGGVEGGGWWGFGVGGGGGGGAGGEWGEGEVAGWKIGVYVIGRMRVGAGCEMLRTWEAAYWLGTGLFVGGLKYSCCGRPAG